MNPFAEFESHAPRLFSLLVDSSWAVTLVFAGIGGSLRLGRRSSAAFRAMVWNLGFGAALVIPVIVMVKPPSGSLERSGPTDSTSVATAGRSDPSTGVAPEATRTVPPASIGVAAPRRTPFLETDLGSVALRCLIDCWALGVLVAIGRFALGHIILYRYSRGAGRSAEADWGGAADEAARRMKISRAVGLTASGGRCAPAVWGFLHPRVFLPAPGGWPFERKMVILLHEFAHIRRNDARLLWLQQIVAAIFWFHPVVLLALAEGRRASEQACDDLVLNAGILPSDYASHLLEISEELLDSSSPRAAFGFFGTRTLEKRLAAILDPVASRRTPKAHVGAILALAAIPALLLISATGPLALADSSSAANAPQMDRSVAVLPGSDRLAAPAPGGDGRASVPSGGAIDRAPETAQSATMPSFGSGDSAETSAADSAGPGASVGLDVAPLPGQPAATVTPSSPDVAPPAVPAATGIIPIASGVAATPAVPNPALGSEVRVAQESTRAPAIRPTDAGPSAAQSGAVVLAEGTRLWLSFADSLSSKTAAKGEPVALVLISDLRVGDATVARAGGRVTGTITAVTHAHPPGMSGSISVRLDPILVRGTAVALRSSKGKAHDSTVTVSLPRHRRWPLGLFRPGDDLEITPDTAVPVSVDESVSVPFNP